MPLGSAWGARATLIPKNLFPSTCPTFYVLFPVFLLKGISLIRLSLTDLNFYVFTQAILSVRKKPGAIALYELPAPPVKIGLLVGSDPFLSRFQHEKELLLVSTQGRLLQ
jgi:hypothetical protein